MTLRLVFMGSPDFSVPSLRFLAQRYPVVGVITQPDRPAGRGKRLSSPAVKTAAQELGLPVIQPERLKQPDAMDQLHTWAPDLIVVAAFGQILRPAVLELPKYGCVNVHASLLPRWRGAAPIQAAILSGDLYTGVTIMLMDPGVDTGPILSQQKTEISPQDTAGDLTERLADMGAQLLIETLPAYVGGEIKPVPQDVSQATYAPMLKKEQGLLDFTRPAEELRRRVRALNPWPGAFFHFQGQPLKVHQARAIETVHAKDGELLIYEGMPAVGTGGGLLVLVEVQPAGKKPMPGGDFLRGVKGWRA